MNELQSVWIEDILGEYIVQAYWAYQHMHFTLVVPSSYSYYIYRQISKGASTVRKESAQKTNGRESPVSCSGQYQLLRGIAQLFQRDFTFSDESDKSIHGSYMTNFHLNLW